MTYHLQQTTRTIQDAILSVCPPHPTSPFLVAIDGRCAAGKTTLATLVQEQLGHKICDVLHTDDFFLRPHQRTKRRLGQPGGNVDWERLAQETISGKMDRAGGTVF